MEEKPEPTTEPLRVDSTLGSLLHRLEKRTSKNEESRSRVFLVTIGTAAVIYLPLVLLARASGLPLWDPSGELHLPFLRDWNVAYMFLVSFPLLVAFVLLDDALLSGALATVQRDKIVVLPARASSRLSSIWQRRFRSVNLWAQGIGAVVGLVLAWINYRAYRPPSVGFWAAKDGRFLPVGWMFLIGIGLFYWVLTLYVLRSAATSFFLRDLVRHAELRLLPAHPDRCGGLRPVGGLGLRNQYVLTLIGLNLVLLVWVSVTHLPPAPYLNALITAAGVAYLVLGPVVFVGPLMPFRAGMIQTKAVLMSEVARRLRVELMRIRKLLTDGEISKSDEELIDRLRKVGSVIDELPVWPFDAGTLRRFVTAYIVPFLGAIAYALLDMAMDRWLGGQGP